MSLPVDYIKVGLSGAPKGWAELLCKRFGQFADAKPIAVAYADYERADSPSPDEILDFARENRLAGFLIDTFVKDGRCLFDWLSDSQLASLIASAKEANLLIALAGSLSGDDFRRAAAFGPDIVAVRGAACRDTRRVGAVDVDCVRQLVGFLS